MADGYDPFFGTAQGYNPQASSSLYNYAQLASQNAYQQSTLQNQSDQLAFQRAQQAFSDAMSLGSAYGYAPGGNWYQFGAGGATVPPAGTPLQQTINQMGMAGGIPGLTGFNTGQTLTAQQQYAQQAAQQAGITGAYAAPPQSQYSPGTFVQLDPSSPESQQYGRQIAYVQPNGQLQRMTDQEARARGWNGSYSADVPYQQFMSLAAAAPQGYMTQTQQAQQQYFTENQQAQQAALAASQATGMYATPGQIQAPGYAMNGSSYFQQPQSTQQAYMAREKDPQAAMQAWVNDTNAQISQSYTARGLPLPGGAGTPTETMAAQQQYFNQAQQYAQMYGQYYAPGAPGQAAGQAAGQAGGAPTPGQQTLQAQQQQWSQGFQQQQFQQQSAQQYLDLLSRLQGPADYGQYLKVLGSTPGGIQGLVGAAAGQYLPGGGATGQAPQAQTLQNLVGAATGQAGGGQGTNAATTGTQQLGTGQGGTASPGGMNYQDFLATAQGLPPPSQIAPQSFNAMAPSQRQTLGSMYSNLGYAQPDINALYQASLPKYAAGSAAGNFRLV